MSNVEIIPAYNGDKVNLFIVLNDWAPNGNAVQSAPLSLEQALAVVRNLNEVLRTEIDALLNRSKSRRCRCGCGALWTDPESDDYLCSHVECDVCGEDFPIDTAIVEHTREYVDGPVMTQYYCPTCASDDEDPSTPEQDVAERFKVELTLGDL